MSIPSVNRETEQNNHNLPLQLTSFIGREFAITQLKDLLRATRLLTLTGAAGVGKTRLSLQVAGQSLGKYRDGIWYVELGSIYEPELVAHKVAAILGCQGEANRPRVDTLQVYLQGRQLLLVLDNCEHLLDPCAELTAKLLVSCSKLHVMTTSREPLGVPGETIYHVGPLSIPNTVVSDDQQRTQESESVRLFIERARAFQPDFPVEEKTLPAIAQICILLDGIPLAVELAAARVRLLSTPEIAAHLQDNLKLLSTGGRAVTARQQTLEACLAWSYDLLTVTEQTLFRRLAVFAGSFTFEDVQAVCAGSNDPASDQIPRRGTVGEGIQHILPSEDALSTLATLVDKSLIQVNPDGKTYYRLLRPIQHYAWGMLTSSGIRDEFRTRHLAYYLELAQHVNPNRNYAEQDVWIKRVEHELDNFRAALEWSLQGGNITAGLSLAAELGEIWWRQGYSAEGLVWLERLLARYPERDITRANALHQAGRLSNEGAQYTQAYTFAEESLKICREIAYQPGEGNALNLLGTITHYRGDRETAIDLMRDSVEIFRRLGDEWNIGAKLLTLSDVQYRSGAIEQAAESGNECLAIFRRLGDKWGLGFALGNKAELARFQGDYRQAQCFELEALEYHIELGNKMDIIFLLEALAITYAVQKDYDRAARLWGSSESLRESIYSFLPPSYQEDYSAYIETTRAALGEQRFEMLWQTGRGLTLEQAIELARRDETGEQGDIPLIDDGKASDKSRSFGLTEREIEVLRLVAQGMTDAEVADLLVISPRTVSKHLQSIYSKIDVNSRSAATRFALENNLA